jgi:5'-nucleotidase (lipoprotein e(P4) family)
MRHAPLMRARRRIPALAFLLFTGCASHAPRPPVPPTPAPPLSLLWSRTSAEHHAAYLQTYRQATERVETEGTRRRKGTWAVILDIDETVLDNSEFEREQVGKPFDRQAFTDWCRREESQPLPGAQQFLHRVHELGGRIALVTNREEEVCEQTRNNLRKESLEFDEVLCSPGTANKNPRFDAVQRGESPSTLPALTIVLWMGDNIQDFPDLFQATMRDAADGAFTDFGTRFFVLPNPMYGSWTENPMR